MNDNDWDNYREALSQAKNNPSRYMVITTDFTTDLQVLRDSMVNPTAYDLFTWMHHMAAKDNEETLTSGKQRGGHFDRLICAHMN